MNSDEDGGYVHRPDGEPVTDEPEPSGFGRTGWGLVVVLVFCTLVVPGLIYLRPTFLGSFGVPYIVALLVLPLLPAVVLGLTAVWSMTGATNGDRGDD
ncbi:hypothetical protein [Halopelagius longus]|uniref:Uncharacterized protein n=1 Tax=Halopelagius longus TaxID=1236180 RepID=A0A1H0YLG0_9EURY|nr:hypothetical protein [Halopelagius longus]RDI72547.1 hypothetical protein DWB78_12925 [Halopelagius longus]SDQ15880.1 hypothetical protein SAMN05216278_0702 [Halopelagius longus]